jgi:hypothetical protein
MSPKRTTNKTAATETEDAKPKPQAPPPPAIDTSSVNLDKVEDIDESDEPHLSNMLMTCLLFIVHTATNAILLSGWNPTRCLFW